MNNDRIRTIVNITAGILFILSLIMVVDVNFIHRFQNPGLSETQLFLYMIKRYKVLLVSDFITAAAVIFVNV